MLKILVLIAALLPVAAAAGEPPAGPVEDPATACRQATDHAQRAASLPPGLLQAIALVETARTDPASGRTVAWPWSINVAGADHVYATKAEAVAAVQSFQATGVRSIDVGCTQINLMYHPDAFATLDDAFDPPRNAAYAARFLTSLHAASGDWMAAAAAYHSQTPKLGADYQQKVAALWAGAPPRPAMAAPGGSVATNDAAYTPEFLARVKQARDDMARLDAAYGPVRSPAPPVARARARMLAAAR